MENRFRSILLAQLALLALMPLGKLAAQGEDEPGSLIEPQIERVEFDEALIDSDDFEIAGYVGFLAIENFQTDVVQGLKLGYHVSEDFFVQASYGLAAAGETSFERLSGGAPLLSGDERDFEYLLVSLGFNLLPGEAFITDSTTLNTVFYISGGVGNTTFAGEDRFTIAYAFGFRSLFADGFSLDIETRDLIMNMDLFGKEEATHNLEMTVSLNVFF